MIAYHAHHDEQIKQRYAQHAHDTEHTEHNDLDTNLLYLYSEDHFLR